MAIVIKKIILITIIGHKIMIGYIMQITDNFHTTTDNIFHVLDKDKFQFRYKYHFKIHKLQTTQMQHTVHKTHQQIHLIQLTKQVLNGA